MYKIKEVSIGYFLRIILILIFAGISYFVLKCLSGVLLPFLIAWLLAYLIYPIVTFVQYRLKFRFRIVSIVAVLLFIIASAPGFIMLALPSLTTEIIQFKDVAIGFINNQINVPSIPDFANNLIREFAEENGIANILQNSGVQDIFKSFAERTWFLAIGTINVVMKIFASCITIMYLFFILLDYERLSEEWQTLIPVRWRHKANTLMNDLTEGMNQYFRGQALIALLVGVMISIGFLIIDFPMAIAFGLFIGVLNLVPYLQLVSLVPMTLLALIGAANNGENFWVIMASALAVVLIVQAIQDFILVPHIMGKRMKLHPATILLSLAIWGKLLGIVGMIMALPLTTLLLGYIKRFHQEQTEEETENLPKTAENGAKIEEK